MYAMDTSYLHPVRGLPLHLTGHGGDVVLDASGSCWVRLLQDGRRREAHRQVVAFARLRNPAPGAYWKAAKEAAALGRAGSLARAATVLEHGPVTPDPAVTGWSWCRLGAGASWLTEVGRHQVAALLRQAARDQQPEQADEFDQWAALRSVGASARGWAPYGQALGIRQACPSSARLVQGPPPRRHRGRHRRSHWALAHPRSLLLGRYDTAGALRPVARSTPLHPETARHLAARLTAAGPGHPWEGVRSQRHGAPTPHSMSYWSRPNWWPRSTSTPPRTVESGGTRYVSPGSATTCSPATSLPSVRE
ncbi:hypothetical protein ACFY71_39825 [Streptomyces cinerochromogenes]|uniref:hypothetical protein n=1 Tax=Streptomyces cinerochromogenes TaxID=66422 RepID=UPI0036B1C5AD